MLISRLMSAAPARLRRMHGGWRLAAAPSPSGIKYRFLTVIVPGVVVLWSIVLDFLEIPSRRVLIGTTALTGFMAVTEAIIVLLTHVFCDIHATDKIKCAVSVLKKTQKLNISLKEGLARFRRTKMALLIVYLTWQILSIIFFLIWAIYTNFIRNDKNHIVISLFSISGYQHFVLIINQLQWSLIIAEVNSSLTALNNQIKQLLQSKGANPSHTYSTMRSLGQCYETICDMLIQIDKHNETFFFFLFLTKFHKFLTTSYNWISNLDNMEVLLIQSNWYIFHLINLLVIVEPCHWIQVQMNCTQSLLIQLSRQIGRGDDRITKELKLFLLQVKMRGPVLTPLGVFNISRPVMVVMLSISTTYLVLLVQEQQNSELL